MKYGTHGYCGKGKRSGSKHNRTGNVVPETDFSYLFRGQGRSKAKRVAARARAKAKVEVAHDEAGL